MSDDAIEQLREMERQDAYGVAALAETPHDDTVRSWLNARSLLEPIALTDGEVCLEVWASESCSFNADGYFRYNDSLEFVTEYRGCYQHGVEAIATFAHCFQHFWDHEVHFQPVHVEETPFVDGQPEVTA